MIYLKTELIEIKLEENAEFNEYAFNVIVLNTGEEFFMSYSTESNCLSCICTMNQVPSDDNYNNISSITGRYIEDCHKDVSGAMEFYIKEIMQFLIKLFIN